MAAYWTKTWWHASIIIISTQNAQNMLEIPKLGLREWRVRKVTKLKINFKNEEDSKRMLLYVRQRDALICQNCSLVSANIGTTFPLSWSGDIPPWRLQHSLISNFLFLLPKLFINYDWYCWWIGQVQQFITESIMIFIVLHECMNNLRLYSYCTSDDDD